MGINAIIKVIERLRGKDGCPWDKQQTPQTLTVYLVEEIYELIDAIESGETDDVREELGDALFHILFIAHIYREMGHFDINDVAAINAEKMTRRHPHVFGEGKIAGVDGVRDQWHKIKMGEEKRDKTASILDSIPAGLPALMRAHRISERAAKTGFDWDDLGGVIRKVEEEWAELKLALTAEGSTGKNLENVALEFGDVLFTLVNVARFARIHPETALSGSTKKFEKRFKYMEKLILEKGQNIESVSHQEMEQLWEEAKKVIG
jgi:MazG family protein